MAGRPPRPIPGQPPSLPARRPPPRPPTPEEEYSEFHGDAEISSDSPPPPPPPRPAPAIPTSDEIYDDFEAGEEQPPPADFSQDVYEATDDLPPTPPPPSSRPPPAIPSSGGAPPLPPGRYEPQEEVYADPDEQPQVYEAVEENKPGAPSAPPPPPIPPNRTKREPLPKPEVPANRPEPKPAPKGGLIIDPSSLANKIGNLRKTNAKTQEKSASDKVYTDNSSFDEKKQLFGQNLRTPPLPPLKHSKGSAETKGTVEVKKLPFQGFGALKPVGPRPPPKVDKEESSSAEKPWMQEKKDELPPPVASPPSRKITPPAPVPPGRKSPVAPPESPGSDGSEELYDDGSSFQILDPLIGNSWYFPKLDRKEAERKLNTHLGEDGTFLVRKSSRDPKKPYTIDVVYQRRIYHLQVRQRADKNFALGTEKDDEMHFKDVKELVEHHKKKEVILIGDHPGSVLLKKSP